MDANTNEVVVNFREHGWVRWGKLLVDLIALQFCLYLSWMARACFTRWWPLDLAIQSYWDLALGMLLIPVGYWLVRLYPGYGLTSVERFRRRVRATFVFFMAFTTWDFLLEHGGRSRGIILLSFLFAFIIPPLVQAAFRMFLVRMNVWGMPIVLIGAGKTGEHIVSSLQREPLLGLRPVVILDDDQTKWGTNIAGVPVIGGVDRAGEFADTISCALLAMPGAGRDRLVDLARKLPFYTLLIVPDLIGMQSLWVEARDLGGIIGLEIQKNLLLRRNWYLKRLMDYALGLPIFICCIPLFFLLAVWIMVISPGNPFYCQVREGRLGRKFKVWKMRTMYLNAEELLHEHLAHNAAAKNEWQQFFKLKDDPRILPLVGKFLRKTSLDELPQLWNVLNGEMSLVGPRPFPHYHLEQFNEDFRKVRRSVMPGMTGMWQVSARSDGDLSIQELLDVYYIRNWSIWLDMNLLARTALVVISGKGAY